MVSNTKSELGIIAVESEAYFPFGKQVFFFEDMLNAYPNRNFDIFFFSAFQWTPEKKLLQGYKYINKKWIAVEEEIPDMIYDRGFSRNTSQVEFNNTFRDFLKASGKQLLNPLALARLLIDKVKFHAFLEEKNIPTLKAYPIQSLESEDFFNSLRYPKLYIKPTFGSQGKGIYVLEKVHDEFHLFDHIGQLEIYDTYNHAYQTILSRIEDSSRYFIQEAAQIKLYNNAPFDIRVFVQNYGDSYKVSGHAVRIGAQESMTSNLNAGGSAIPLYELDTFFQEYYGKTALEIEIQLKNVCTQAAQELQKTYGHFIEIGFDVLCTLDKGPILIEANSKPSRWVFNVITDYLESQGKSSESYKTLRKETVKVPLLYTSYLLKHNLNCDARF